MSTVPIVTFLSDTERALVVALLEERLTKLRTTICRTEHTRDTASLDYLVETTVALLDKLYQTSAVGYRVSPEPERTPPQEARHELPSVSPLRAVKTQSECSKEDRE
jgi:hypothetical protein